jgi:hypothetical protein
VRYVSQLGLAGAFEQKLTVSTKSGYAKFLKAAADNDSFRTGWPSGHDPYNCLSAMILRFTKPDSRDMQ